jgi:hypothetical protein
MRDRTRHGPRSFDAVAIGHAETDTWAAYYRHEWVTFLRGAIRMVDEGFGMSRRASVTGAWYVLRANQAWAPYPDNDPDLAREYMRRFYDLVMREVRLDLDPERAAVLEVEWWRVHREHQHEDGPDDPLVTALVDLYTHVYAADRAAVRPAARWRVEAMDLSDRWVAAGCDLTDPVLAAERRALVASYSSLLDAVSR